MNRERECDQPERSITVRHMVRAVAIVLLGLLATGCAVGREPLKPVYYAGPGESVVRVTGAQWTSLSVMGGMAEYTPDYVAVAIAPSFSGAWETFRRERARADRWLRGLGVSDEGRLVLLARNQDAAQFEDDGLTRPFTTALAAPRVPGTDIRQLGNGRNVWTTHEWCVPIAATGEGLDAPFAYDVSFSPSGVLAQRDGTLHFRESAPDEQGRLTVWHDPHDRPQRSVSRYRPPFTFDRIERRMFGAEPTLWLRAHSLGTFLYVDGDNAVGVCFPSLSLESADETTWLPLVIGRFESNSGSIIELTVVDRTGAVHRVSECLITPERESGVPAEWLTYSDPKLCRLLGATIRRALAMPE